MSTKEQAVRLRLDISPCYNYLLYQHKAPICYGCRVISNKGIDDANISLCIEGEHLELYEQAIGQLPRGELLLPPPLLKVDREYLLACDQEEVLTLSCRLQTAEQLLCEEVYQLRIQPYGYWHGNQVMPELLASFVLSDRPILSRISIKAAEYLQQWTGNSALDGYQQRAPNRVRHQVAAIYEALRNESLVYASIPPSFTEGGQRVRLVDEVLTSKLANCLDLTLLFAACLEYIGLRPILVLVAGHAFVGCWLVEDNYPYPFGDDASFLLKAASDGISEMVLLETTSVCASSLVPFEEAVRVAERSLQVDDNLELFIDVFRSRLGHIYPLRSRRLSDGQWIVENTGIEHETHKHQIHRLQRYELEFGEQAEFTKQDIWERKLLDMSLRNNLLNLRIGKSILPLISFNISEWEDHLQTDGSFQILGNPSNQPPEQTKGSIYKSIQYEEELGRLILEEIKSQRLHAFIPEDEVDSALKHLHRSARTALEENGANSLFLSLGVLRWYESEQSAQARYAPILLYPVDIVRQRPSVGGKYSIRSRGEDIVLNITLLEMLKQKFGVNINAEDLMISDEKGLDVQAILSAVKVLVRELRGWDVLPEAMLGLFSFSKFVLWNDIHSKSDKLRESPIIRALMDGTSTEPDLLEPIDVRQSDYELQPQELLLPIDIDSSQLQAVLDAGRGRSFVLHGPPGTGKSQTITNMIAYALSQGKRVLFVAEKMAALSVVQSRLERIGLGAFCLELHSNKATKSHILEQLARPLDLTAQHDPERSASTNATLYEQRRRLAAYVEALHRKQDSGYSLYEYIEAYQELESQGIEPIEVARYAELDALQMRQIEDELQALDIIYAITGSPHGHPLSILDTAGKAMIAAPELKQRLECYRKHLPELETLLRELSELLGIELDDSRACLEHSLQLFEQLLSEPEIVWSGRDLSFYANEGQSLAWDIAVKATEREEAVATAIETWNTKHNKSGRLLDDTRIAEAWHQAEEVWFLPRYFRKKALLKSLRTELSNALLSEKELSELVQLSREREERKVQAIQATVAELRPFCGNDMRPTADVRKRYEHVLALRSALYGLAKSSSRNGLEDILHNLRYGLPQQVSVLQALARSGRTALRNYFAAEEQLAAWASLRIPQTAYVATLKQQLGLAMEALAGLRDWRRWCEHRAELEARGFGVFIEVLESTSLAPEPAYRSMCMGIYRAWIERLVVEDRALSTFNGLLFEDIVKRYRQSVRSFQELSKAELQARLVQRLQQGLESECSNELTFLKRTLGNKGRGKAMRDILQAIPNLLPHLAPCMLMSPISVAQYLSLEGEKFDLVIFDEASQMPTSEAVGAIARGNSLVVVGDPKQMPPTSFFSNQQIEDELADLDDTESILDECIALAMPEYYLSWHYRSKHESLIAFSNTHYYQDRLYTFPSVDDQASRVRLIPIAGTYQKGSTRNNRAEAEAVVSEIIRRLEDTELRQRSIGVVAFNQSQQHLIEDLLMATLGKRKDLEAYALQSDEPIFVKNLENVQGDERDVVLFSVGYGPDKNGNVSMNFGPLNQQGGERRLNVAVSRARYEMLVFSSMTSKDIDLKRSKAKGVEGLKLFLEFAERGTIPAQSKQEGNRKSELVASLACELRHHGYEVCTFVGRSAFRIDIAVLDPGNPEHYLLGILCDGLGYYQTQTTQDRELVQPSVLTALGWEIMRLWALDWYHDKERVIAGIIERLEWTKSTRAAQKNRS